MNINDHIRHGKELAESLRPAADGDNGLLSRKSLHLTQMLDQMRRQASKGPSVTSSGSNVMASHQNKN